MANQPKAMVAHQGEVVPARQADGDRLPRSERRIFSPRADIIETADEFLVVADLPGADEKMMEINLDKNVLTISASPAAERMEGYVLHYSEYAPGDFQRRFVLSEMIARDRIEAVMNNGVLYLHLPKAGAAKPHKITVKGG